MSITLNHIHKWSLAIGLAVLTVILITVLILSNNRSETNVLSQQTSTKSENIFNSVGTFTPLTLDPSSSEYTINEATVSYDSGILIYQIKTGSEATVTVSQQKIPESLQNQLLESEDTFQTTYGTASINLLAEGRTTASVFSDNGVLVLFNTQDSISIDTMKSVVRSLR